MSRCPRCKARRVWPLRRWLCGSGIFDGWLYAGRRCGLEEARDELRAERAHEGTCPKHVGCLPESCGDCPRNEQDSGDATSDMQETHAFAKRFPELVGHIGTHYPGCYKAHPACAWRVGWSDGIEHVVWMLRNTEGPVRYALLRYGPEEATDDDA